MALEKEEYLEDTEIKEEMDSEVEVMFHKLNNTYLCG